MKSTFQIFFVLLHDDNKEMTKSNTQPHTQLHLIHKLLVLWPSPVIERKPVSVAVFKRVAAVNSPDCVNARHLCRHGRSKRNLTDTVVQLGIFSSQGRCQLARGLLKPGTNPSISISIPIKITNLKVKQNIKKFTYLRFDLNTPTYSANTSMTQ